MPATNTTLGSARLGRSFAALRPLFEESERRRKETVTARATLIETCGTRAPVVVEISCTGPRFELAKLMREEAELHIGQPLTWHAAQNEVGVFSGKLNRCRYRLFIHAV